MLIKNARATASTAFKPFDFRFILFSLQIFDFHFFEPETSTEKQKTHFRNPPQTMADPPSFLAGRPISKMGSVNPFKLSAAQPPSPEVVGTVALRLCLTTDLPFSDA
jgi:hypothetical protein